jgi:hypothetical protein
MSADEMTAWLRKQVEADKAYWERWLTQGVIVRRDHGEEHIADCEAKLAVLDEHYILTADDRNEKYEQFSIMSPPFPPKDRGCVTCHYGSRGGVNGYGRCRTVRLLGSAYQHREGFQAEWTQP